MFEDAHKLLLDALARNGMEIEIVRNSIRLPTKAIRNSKERYLAFLPEVDIRAGDKVVNKVSQEILHITDTEVSIVEGKPLSVRAFYETETQHLQKHNMPSTVLNFSGNFQGAILNVQSTLNSVSQALQATPNFQKQEKDDLQSLVSELLKELEKAPPESAEDAEAIAEAAKALMEAATKEKPNKTTIKVTAEGLKQAAQNLVAVLPEVFKAATDIATRIQTIMN